MDELAWVREEIQSKRDVMVASMGYAVAIPNETGERVVDESIRQFVGGYLYLLEALANGDDAPQREYIETVIPELRRANMPLSDIIDGGVRCTVALVVLVRNETRSWWIDQCSKHLAKVVRCWEAQP